MRRTFLWSIMVVAVACAPQPLPASEHFAGAVDSAGDTAADAGVDSAAGTDGAGETADAADTSAGTDAATEIDAVLDIDAALDADSAADADAWVDADAAADADAAVDTDAAGDLDAKGDADLDGAVAPDGDAAGDADALIDADSSSDLAGDVTPGCSAEAVLCNGVDDDCDGTTDEDCQCATAAYLAPDCTACADGFEAIPTAKGQACAADFPVWGPRPDSPPSGWFGDNGDETISDSHTKLRWQKGFSPAGQTWDAAQKYCFGLTLGGFTDWRMPTVAELTTLRDLSKAAPAIVGAFAGTPSDFFWTALPLQLSPAEAWSLFFSAGMTTAADKTSPFYVRCVR